MALNSKVAQNLIVAQACFVLIHTLTYVFTLKLWNSFSATYIAMYILQEIPNAYNFIICLSAIAD